MKSRVLINFAVSSVDKASYTDACKSLGISVSDVCRRALNEAVLLTKKLQPSTPKEKDKCPNCGSTKLGQEAPHPHIVYCEDCGWYAEPHEIDNSFINSEKKIDNSFKGGKNYDCT